MMAMRLALAVGRLDVDAMLDELDHDQFVEWAAFFSIEPQGWNAQNLIQARISTMIGLSAGSKRIREKDMVIKTVAPSSSRNDARRFRAMAIRSEIRQRHLKNRKCHPKQ